MRHRWQDHLLFVREFRANFATTGALAPSGRPLARALTDQLRRWQAVRPATGRSLRILECGPGTGAVTREILPILGADDRLDLVEANVAFVDHLQRRFETDPVFARHATQCRLLHQRVEQIEGEPCYDLIISGLPLNNFQVDQVWAVLATFERLVAPGGSLSFFEYVAVRRIRSLVGRKADRHRLRGIGRLLEQLFERHASHRQMILPNVPPAWVHHVNIAPPA